MWFFLLALLIPATALAQSVRIDDYGDIKKYVPPSEETVAEYKLAIETFNACLHRGKALQPCPKPKRPVGHWQRVSMAGPPPPPVEDRWTLFGLPIRWAGDPHACSLAPTDRVPNQLFCARDNRDRPADSRVDRSGQERVERPRPTLQPPSSLRAKDRKGKRHER